MFKLEASAPDDGVILGTCIQSFLTDPSGETDTCAARGSSGASWGMRADGRGGTHEQSTAVSVQSEQVGEVQCRAQVLSDASQWAAPP